MRIYAQLENVGSSYEIIVPTKLSLTPLENDCYYIDLLIGEVDITVKSSENMGDWIPYNTIIEEDFFFNCETNDLIKDDHEMDPPGDMYIEGYICKEYKEGILTKTYFKDGYSRRILPINSCK